MTHTHACLLFLSLLLATVVLGWYSLRCAERSFDQAEMP
jgi:hypothetical protein